MHSIYLRLFFYALVIGAVGSRAFAQDHELLIPPEGQVNLNEVIAGDTTAAGERVDLDRVYVLQRGGAYLVNDIMRNTYPVRIKAEDGDGQLPIIVRVVNPETGDSGEMWRNQESLWLKNIAMVGYIEATNEVAFIPGGFIRTDAPGFDIVMDGCIMSQTRGQFIRTQLATRVVKITNTIFANMGDLGRSNFGAGKGVDFRDTSCDTALFQNCTFVNFQDRPIRHRSSTGAINNFIFDHNTLLNGMSYHGTLALGQVGEHVQITNNLFLDTFIAGQDTDAVRQSEFDESGELDDYGFGKMTWIFTEPVNENTQFTIGGNYYSVSSAVQAFYDEVSATDNAFRGEGSPLTDHILGKLSNSSTAFIKEAIEVANRPDPMLAMARWYRDPNGANKTKETTNFQRDRDDYDRRDLTYFVNTFDASYPTSAAAYTGADDSFPAGDLNWFPDKKAEWEDQATSVELLFDGDYVVRDYQLAQNYPNPFNPATTIAFEVRDAGQVTLEIYNMMGQKVAILVDEHLLPGTYTTSFRAGNFSSGVYFYKLQVNNFTAVKKMMYLK